MKKNTLKVKKIASVGIVSAIYIALTFITYPVSYGELGIEIRISEILVLLCFFNSDYVVSISLGCCIANLFGTMGIIDAIFGTLATFFSCFLISKSRNIFLSSVYPIIINGIVVGMELYFIFDLPIFISMISVAIGEFIVITVIGCPLFSYLKNNKMFLEIVSADRVI